MITRSVTPVRARERLPREEGGLVHEQRSERIEKAIHQEHISVMAQEVIELLALQESDLVLDATAGQAGHSFHILDATKKTRVLALDADGEYASIAREKLAPFGDRAQVVEGNFADVQKILHTHHVDLVDKALFDLGWNSGHLESGRGFSFLRDEPLLMNYSTRPASGFTAQEILNEWDEKTLANVFFGYSEERFARRIATAIVERRKIQPIMTTLELVEIIRDAVPAAYRRGRLHFATKTFQALRMAVNDELGVIERGLLGVWNHVSCGGRVAVISFHSIEDRIVKRLFASFAKIDGRLVVKKPMVPSRAEISHNPRARSAKLRVIEKVCTP